MNKVIDLTNIAASADAFKACNPECRAIDRFMLAPNNFEKWRVVSDNIAWVIKKGFLIDWNEAINLFSVSNQFAYNIMLTGYNKNFDAGTTDVIWGNVHLDGFTHNFTALALKKVYGSIVLHGYQKQFNTPQLSQLMYPIYQTKLFSFKFPGK